MTQDPRTSRTAAKHAAQVIIMDGIAKTIGYWAESGSGMVPGWNDWTPEEQGEFQALVKAQADRLAKVFGYDQAWIA